MSDMISAHGIILFKAVCFPFIIRIIMYDITRMGLWKRVTPDSKVHGANMGPTWVLSDPGAPHVGPINLALRAHLNITNYAKLFSIGLSALSAQLYFMLINTWVAWDSFILPSAAQEDINNQIKVGQEIAMWWTQTQTSFITIVWLSYKLIKVYLGEGI